MKTEKLELFNEILIMQMIHWSLYPLALSVIGVVGTYIGEDRPAALLWGICGLLAVAYFFLRERVQHLALFFLLHIGVAALFFFLPARTIVERVLCVACGVGYFIESMVKRFREEGTGSSFFSPVVAVGICVAAILFQHYQGRADWDFYYVLTLVSVFAVYLITSYIQRYLNFLVVNDSSTGYMPAADMFRSGMGLVVLYTVFGVIVLLLFTNFDWLGVIWNGLKNGLVSVLRFLFSLLPHEQAAEEEVVIPAVQPAAENDFVDMLEPAEPFLLWEILEVVVIIAFICAAVFVVIKASIWVFRFIRQRFAEGYGVRSRFVTGEEEMDVREKCDLAKTTARESSKSSLFGFLTPTQRIRKLYRKKILSSAYELTGGGEDTSAALSRLTPRECGEKLGATAMADIYEQVRYSDLEATQETLRTMRVACK